MRKSKPAVRIRVEIGRTVKIDVRLRIWWIW